MCSGSRAWLFYKISVGGHGDDDQDLEIKEEELEETLLVNLEYQLVLFIKMEQCFKKVKLILEGQIILLLVVCIFIV